MGEACLFREAEVHELIAPLKSNLIKAFESVSRRSLQKMGQVGGTFPYDFDQMLRFGLEHDERVRRQAAVEPSDFEEWFSNNHHLMVVRQSSPEIMVFARKKVFVKAIHAIKCRPLEDGSRTS